LLLRVFAYFLFATCLLFDTKTKTQKKKKNRRAKIAQRRPGPGADGAGGVFATTKREAEPGDGKDSKETQQRAGTVATSALVEPLLQRPSLAQRASVGLWSAAAGAIPNLSLELDRARARREKRERGKKKPPRRRKSVRRNEVFFFFF
jgi:hypothetical protein